MTNQELARVANEVRKGIVTGVHAAKSGHPGGSLGAADIMTYLYFEEMNVDPTDPRKADRDRFVLSKGHCAPGLYAVLAERGFFPKEDLETLRHIGSRLQGHPNMNDTPGIDMSTGSLGQGISAAVGMALAAKHWVDSYRVYTLLGDGECEEGQVWEAAMFAGNHNLDNLVAIVDHNGLQIDGTIDEVNSAMPLADKFRAFKWHVIELADGNDMTQIEAAFAEAREVTGVPVAIIAETVKGKGVSEVKKVATRVSYGEALVGLGNEHDDFVVLDADLAAATQTGKFKAAHPERFYDAGIAESNLMGLAAGIATTGHVAFASTFAMFAAGRAYEQVRNSIGYPHLNVKIGATHAGISVGEDGATHQCCEDIALMRTIPGMTVIVPADDIEARACVRAAYEFEGPVYMRFGRLATPVINDREDYGFKIGRGVVVREGSDVTIIACGLMVAEALEAAEALAADGIDAEVINMHTIKPLDERLVVASAKKTGRVVTAEEHSIIGGLGEAVASVLAEQHPVPMRRVGVRDVYGESGPAVDLLHKCGLDADGIEAAVRSVL